MSTEEHIDESEKKEQERLLRSMNKPRGRVASGAAAGNARPVSWNVHLSGRAVSGPTAKNEQTEAVKLLQEQLKREDVTSPPHHTETPAAPASVAPVNVAPVPRPLSPSPTASQTSVVNPPRVAVASPPRDLEEQAQLNAFNAFNEKRELERINKWTRGRSMEHIDRKTYEKPFEKPEKPIPAVLLRQFDVEAEARGKRVEHEPRKEEVPGLNSEFAAFSSNVTVAAKAIRQRKGEVLATACFAAVETAKVFAALVNDDTEIIILAKGLKELSDKLRSRLDSGSSGQEHFNEISTSLGQLYLSVVALS